VALYQTVVFAAAVIGPLAGGYLTDLAGFKLIFAVSFVGRLVGMLIFLVRVRSPGPKSDR
jgi:predicted MFS family arabinose efflux permease